MKFLTLLIALLIFAAPAKAELDYAAFNQIPVLDKGRIKPLGAFAKLYLENLAAQENIGYKNASEFLAETLFNPATASEKPVFYIQSEALKSRLNLDPSKKTYTLQELQPSIEETLNDVVNLMSIPQSELTKDQKDLLHIHENVLSYTKLLRSFSMLLPLNIEWPEKYKAEKTEEYITYLSLRPLEQRIERDLQAILKAKGNNFDAYSASQKSIALLGFQIQSIRSGGENNAEFQIIPIDWNTQGEQPQNWASPWELLKSGQASPQTKAYLKLWQDLAEAYREDNAAAFQTISVEIYNTALSLSHENISPARLKTELIYQTIKPYHATMALYALSLLLFAFASSLNRHPGESRDLSSKQKKIAACAVMTFLIGIMLHTAGITARIYILARPPVGTLYESMLFVSAICAAIGLAFALKARSVFLPITALIATLFLLSIAPVMLQQNDSLELLVAVLNTNFWLAVHVLCITAGYALCILTACTAHTYLFARLKNPKNPLLPTLYKTTYKSSLVALLLTAIGTVLGGIWADQSWGRFWGWDPKENGALLIVLWLIWIQHGRLSGHLRDLPFIAGMAALNIIVALAWFGVNLLGVGLHSYGFTSGIADGLFIFCSLETILILGVWILIRLKEAQKA